MNIPYTTMEDPQEHLVVTEYESNSSVIRKETTPNAILESGKKRFPLIIKFLIGSYGSCIHHRGDIKS